MDAKKAKDTAARATILMFPWIGYGHLSAYLELAKVLSKRNFHIYYCSTPVNLDSIKPKLIPPSSIQFVELHLPSSDDFPPHLHTTNGLPSHLKNTLHQAFAASAENFETILQTLRPNLLIYDSLQPWAPRLASALNIPAINFNTTGAFIISHFLHSFQYPDSKYPFSDFVLHNYYKAKYNTAADGAANPERPNRGIEAFMYSLKASCDVTLINSFRELEGKYIDYLSVQLKRKVIPIGPLVYEPNQEEEDKDYSRIKQWLDKREPLSTVFVSFGSEFFPSKEEMEEIAHGVEHSEANFIWVIRFPKGEEKSAIEEAFPKGFSERAGERGIMIKDWAPQSKILQHGSIGGFVSHCGWNSVMESIKFGVPVIGVPIHVDQPFNAGVLEEVGVGVEVKRDPDGKIQRIEVAKQITQVVVKKTREDIWKKVKEMSENLRRNKDEKIDEMVAEISLLLKL